MITVLGSINMDLIATVERLPKPGETVVGDSFATAPGGKGANQALAAARAGAVVHIAGAVGRDTFAEPALGLLREAGADCTSVRAVDRPTGTALIVVDEAGENMITIIAGANGALGPEDARRAVGAMAEGDTLLLQLEIPERAVESALLAARERRVTTILNVAPLTRAAARLARLADIVIANEAEFAGLAGLDASSDDERERHLMRLHEDRGQTFVVTLGARGAIAACDGRLVRVAALSIVTVDTVGAGDTFCGYLAAGLDRGLRLDATLARAAAAASLACLDPGAQPSIPTAAEVDARLS